MRPRARQHLSRLFVLALAAPAIGSGCEEARLREDPQVQATNPQQRAMQAQVSAKGLAALLSGGSDAASAQFSIQHDARTAQLDEQQAQLGPVLQDVSMDTLTATPSTNLLDITLELNDLAVLIPTRQRVGAQTQICRWRARAQHARATVQLTIESEDGVWTFRTDRTPNVTLEAFALEPVGACTGLTAAQQSGALEVALRDYTREAIEGSVTALVKRDLLQSVGLIERGLELTRLSELEHRRGQLLLAGRTSSGNPVRLTGDGLVLEMDYAIQARKASCVPPKSLAPTNPVLTGPIPASLLDQFSADLAVSLTTPLIQRLFQAFVLSGFLCRGIDGRTSVTYSKKDIRLPDVGIDDARHGEEIAVVLSPGELPEVTLRPDNGTVEVRWEKLTLGLHGEVLGVRVRLAEVTTSLTFSLRPVSRPTPGVLGVAIETVDVTTATMSTEWRNGAEPDEEAVKLWTRRLLVLVFGEETTLPLPLTPGSNVTMVGSQVRPNDVVLLLRFAEATE